MTPLDVQPLGRVDFSRPADSTHYRGAGEVLSSRACLTLAQRRSERPQLRVARSREVGGKQRLMRTIGAVLEEVAPARGSIRLPFRDDLTASSTVSCTAGTIASVADSRAAMRRSRSCPRTPLCCPSSSSEHARAGEGRINRGTRRRSFDLAAPSWCCRADV